MTYPIPGGSRTDTMQYDVFGQRTGATLQGQARTYTWFGDRMLEEYGCHPECAYAGALYAGASYYDPLLARQMGGMKEYPLYDGTGTARGTVNQAGTPQYSWDLDAFGRYMSPYGDSTWFPYRFGGAWGYESDPSGLLQVGARWYWPEIGRFLTQDPTGDGMNWYAYAGNNPVVGVDPEGLAESASLWGNMLSGDTWAAGLTQGGAILADTAWIFGNPYRDRGVYNSSDPLIAAAQASAGVGVAAIGAIGVGEGLGYVGGRLGAQIILRPGGAPGIALRLANLGRRFYAIALHGPHHEFPWLAARLGLASARMWHLQMWAGKKGAQPCPIRIPLWPE